jgi:PIN domain nuclease of toxin-antitoxin system
MRKNFYLFDTHALIFWRRRQSVPDEFIKFFDKQNDLGNLYVSSISFWEIALLAKKGKIKVDDLQAWKDETIANSNLTEIMPTASEMIKSVQLPDLHKDPFDRLLITQAINKNATIVTKDKIIEKYPVLVYRI